MSVSCMQFVQYNASTFPSSAYYRLANVFAGAYTPSMTGLITTGAVGITGFSQAYTSGLSYYFERISGFFVPPVTANYTFYLFGDNSADLAISTDESTANATTVAYVSRVGLADEWYWVYNGCFRTASRPLQARKRYYFTSRHAQVAHTDYLFAGVRNNRCRSTAVMLIVPLSKSKLTASCLTQT